MDYLGAKPYVSNLTGRKTITRLVLKNALRKLTYKHKKFGKHKAQKWTHFKSVVHTELAIFSRITIPTDATTRGTMSKVVVSALCYLFFPFILS